MSKRFIEADIKLAILNNKDVFSDIGESVVVFEKAIMRGRTIMDALICSKNKGVIGIEIKTERDSTQRLNKQLKDYEKVCDYVYVLCHDSHVEKVEAILKKYQHNHVGIIAYISFKDTAFLGMYKEAYKSPYKDVYHTLDVLWKQEILTLLGSLKHYVRRVAEETDLRGESLRNRTGGVRDFSTQSMYTNRSTKGQLIRELITRFGEHEANNIFCNVFINNTHSPDKSITIRHFKKG